MPATYRVILTPASMRRIEAMIMAAPLMAKYYEAAMAVCVQHVTTEAKKEAAAAFAHPTGTLMRSITGRVEGPLRGVVGVPISVPYGRRRELGFTGMTDRLGRYYANDPGKFYLQQGLEHSLPFLEATFLEASKLAVQRIAR